MPTALLDGSRGKSDRHIQRLKAAILAMLVGDVEAKVVERRAKIVKVLVDAQELTLKT